MTGIDRLLHDSRTNARLAWVIALFLLIPAGESILDLDILWTGVTGVMLAVILLPPAAHQDPWTMLPWEILFVAMLPVIGRSIDAIPPSPWITYAAVAAFALIVAVELHAFTPVEMGRAFALTFVVLTTIAAAGLFSVGQLLSDTIYGTTYLPTSADALITNYLIATATGAAAATLFLHWTRRHPAFTEVDS